MTNHKRIFYFVILLLFIIFFITKIDAAIPAGTILFQENFEDTNLAGRGWYSVSGVAINTTEHVAGSTASLQTHFTQGSTAPVVLRHLITDTDSAYMSYWVKYSSTWQGSGVDYHPHENNFITNEDDPDVGPGVTNLTVYIEQNYQNGFNLPSLNTQDTNNINASNINVNLIGVTENRAVSSCNGVTEARQINDCYSCGSTSGWCNERIWIANSSQPNITLNQWHFVQGYFKLNTIQGGIAQQDGSIAYYLDGQKVFEDNHVYLRTGAHPNMKFDEYLFVPYIGVGSPVDQYMWMDNLTVATGDPTASSGPTVSLNTPADNYNTTNQTVSFNATGTDAAGLANMTLYGNWSGSWTSNSTNSSPVSGTQTRFISSIPKGKYIWNVLACDSIDNCTFASSNRTFTINSPGDLNNDNKVDSSDLLIIIKYILGIDQSNNVADVNGNGAVNIFDLVTTANLYGKQYGTDNTAPSIINSTPTNNTAYAAGTTYVPIFIETNERATCKYANFSSGNFTVNMTNFTKTGGISHTVNLTGLTNGTHNYYIKCQDEAGNLNNTNYMINFSIASSGGGASYRANEPQGLTLISERAFNAKVENSWYLDSPPDDYFTIVTDATAPVSPSNIGQALYPTGFPSGAGPINTEIDLSGNTQLYMSFPMKLSSNFYGCGTNKIFFIWIGGQPGVYLKVDGNAADPLTFWISTQSSGSSADPLAVGTTVSRNQWANIEVYMKTNTGGNSDGIVKIWQDGNLVINLSNVRFVLSGDNHNWERVSWNPTWGGGCNPLTVPADQYMWMDNVYLSGAA